MVTQKKVDAICEVIGKFRKKMTFHKRSNGISTNGKYNVLEIKFSWVNLTVLETLILIKLEDSTIEIIKIEEEVQTKSEKEIYSVRLIYTWHSL